METGLIFTDYSPLCDIMAAVERYRNSCYFHLVFKPTAYQPTYESCWLYNRPAEEVMPYGTVPDPYDVPMPVQYVRHAPCGIELDEKKFEVVWFMEGDAAALLYDKMLLAVIMPSSKTGKYHKFSRYAIGKAPYAWEIENIREVMTKRANTCRRIWKKYGVYGDIRGWMLRQAVPAYKFVGEHLQDYNIANEKDRRIDNGGTYPPKVVVTGKRNGTIYGVTAGLSLPAMPRTAKYFPKDTKNERHTEIGFAVEERLSAVCNTAYSEMNRIAVIPWTDYAPIAHGHTIELNGFEGFPEAVLLNPKYYSGFEAPEYENFPGDCHVNMLWIIPITEKEYDFVRLRGSDKLLERAVDLGRVHIFTGEPKFNV
ncbi:MAG: suppressor of fused domain protein [Ruminococcus sp.]|nr:suppressor of fused domain protein [Ruminococcus sp.]